MSFSRASAFVTPSVALDIDFQGQIVCGKFVDIEKPAFTERMHDHYEKTLGDRYKPMGPEGGWIHE